MRVLILTALAVEYMAVAKRLQERTEISNPAGALYERGTLETPSGNFEVWLAQTGKGNVKAGIETTRAIDFVKPDLAIFVGVAGSLKDDVKLGDVVVAVRTFGYEHGKIEKGEILSRPVPGLSSYGLEKIAEADARDPEQRWFAGAGTAPQLHVGAVVAGNKVVADANSDIAKFLKTHFNEALAVEMESEGFNEAIHACEVHNLKSIIVRGISDELSNKSEADRDGWQHRAADNATSYAFYLLHRLKKKV